MGNTQQYRTHKICDLDISLAEQTIKIAGWLRTKRNHGQILFIEVADSSGVIQCVIDTNSSLFETIEKTPYESVVAIEGVVTLRPSAMINKNITTGEIELIIKTVEILSKAEPLPFDLDQANLGEELQSQYRFLYLRRSEMQKMLQLRAKVLEILRTKMKELSFMEVQTPILTSSSPEGARDYVVPSRLHPGKFYALPQAPQQFKQLLMAACVDKYFQIAPCFRDEDSRADRIVGEFYQLDFEISFATQEEVLFTLEGILTHLFNTIRPDRAISEVFPRISYKQAIKKYGSDKPDLRNPLILQDITHLDPPLIFKNIIVGGGKMIAISAKIDDTSRKFFDQLLHYIKSRGGSGMAWAVNTNGNWAGTMNNMFSDAIKNEILCDDHNALFLIADKEKIAYQLAGFLRNELGERLGLIDKNKYAFCFITDFPMFEWSDENNAWDFTHNPFSMPQDIHKSIEEMLAYQYDVVCNGYEITSGAVRNHDISLIQKVFALINRGDENIEEILPLFKAFKYGICPHAGAAIGLERILMLLSDQKNVRNTVAFPLNQRGEDLFMNAPSIINQKLLKELKIAIMKEE
jgi:aspartyl-tRNA synthetase